MIDEIVIDDEYKYINDPDKSLYEKIKDWIYQWIFFGDEDLLLPIDETIV